MILKSGGSGVNVAIKQVLGNTAQRFLLISLGVLFKDVNQKCTHCLCAVQPIGGYNSGIGRYVAKNGVEKNPEERFKIVRDIMRPVRVTEQLRSHELPRALKSCHDLLSAPGKSKIFQAY